MYVYTLQTWLSPSLGCMYRQLWKFTGKMMERCFVLSEFYSQANGQDFLKGVQSPKEKQKQKQKQKQKKQKQKEKKRKQKKRKENKITQKQKTKNKKQKTKQNKTKNTLLKVKFGKYKKKKPFCCKKWTFYNLWLQACLQWYRTVQIYEKSTEVWHHQIFFFAFHSAYLYPYFSRTWWKTLTHQIWHELVHNSLEPGQFTLISMGLIRYSCGHISGPMNRFGLWMFFIMLQRYVVSKMLKCKKGGFFCVMSSLLYCQLTRNPIHYSNSVSDMIS